MSVLIIFLVFTILSFGESVKNNVCSTIEGYGNIDDNENCWYNPDVDATPEKIAENHGFKLQIHSLFTEDGYNLKLFRVINPNLTSVSKPPVFIQHGLISNAMEFLSIGNKSFAFILANDGYDVWLGNFRGTYYCTDHEFLDRTGYEYWDFSLHQLGIYDLPSSVEYINNVTSQKILYIGHSMGATTCYIYTSLRKSHAEKYLKGVISIAGNANFRNYKAPTNILLPLFTNLLSQMRQNRKYSIFSEGKNLRKIMSNMLKRPDDLGNFILIFDLLFGPSEFDKDRIKYMPLITRSQPSTACVKLIQHYVQIIFSKEFKQYDYGLEQNLVKYGRKTPPKYYLENITLPYVHFYGKNDFFCNEEDTNETFKKNGSKMKSIYVVPENDSIRYNHIDFVLSANWDIHFYHKYLRNILKKWTYDK